MKCSPRGGGVISHREKRDAIPRKEKGNLLKGRKAPGGEKRDYLPVGRTEALSKREGR